MYTICDNERTNLLKRQWLLHVFDILAGQGFLTEEENLRLKLELADKAGKNCVGVECERSYNAESRNI